jgi:hypothetical protein
MMHGRGKSDAAIVAVKLANKTERSVAESVEPRAATKGNADQQSTCRAQYRVSVPPVLVSIRQAFAVGPEVGAVCGKAARTDLCWGREVTRVPTATESVPATSIHVAAGTAYPDGAKRRSGYAFARPTVRCGGRDASQPLEQILRA